MVKRSATEVELVAATRLMRFTEDEAVTYLKVKGYEMSRFKYHTILGEIDAMAMGRLFEIAREFPRHHLERIETLKCVEKELWRTYHSVAPENRMPILKEIKEIQPYLSTYIEATAKVMSMSKSMESENENYTPPQNIPEQNKV